MTSEQNMARKKTNRRSENPLVCLVVMALFASAAVFPISAQSPSRRHQELPTKKETSALRLTVSTTRTVLCSGSSVRATLELTNKGSAALELDLTHVWSFVSFVKYGGDSKGKRRANVFTLVDKAAPARSGDKISLSPNQTVKRSKLIALDDPFFSRRGTYYLSVSTVRDVIVTIATDISSDAMIESNEVRFKLVKCKNHR